MARKNYYGRKTTKTKKRKTRAERTREIISFAYNLGLIDRGRANPDSRVSKAYNRGKAIPEERKKSSLL